MALAYYAGTRLLTTTFDALFEQVPRTFRKLADQFYDTTTTFQNDVDLTCSLEANSVYEVEFNLVMSGTAGDIQTSWSAPSGATGYKACMGPAASSTSRDDTTMATAAHNLATVRSYGLNHATNFAGAREKGLVVTVGAGTLTLQHTQLSSNAAPSGLATNSWMTVRKIS
jgi:hypothetical protein